MASCLMLLGVLMLGKSGARQLQCEVTTIARRPAHKVTYVRQTPNTSNTYSNAQATLYISTYVCIDFLTTLTGENPSPNCMRLCWRLSCPGRLKGFELALPLPLTLALTLQMTLPLKPTRPDSFSRQEVYLQDATCSASFSCGVVSQVCLGCSALLL
jgi:hypothetical protein